MSDLGFYRLFDYWNILTLPSPKSSSSHVEMTFPDFRSKGNMLSMALALFRKKLNLLHNEHVRSRGVFILEY